MDVFLSLPLPDGFLLLVALAGLGSFVYGVAGFGSGLVAIPLALHAHPASLVLAVYALLDMVNVGRVLWAQPARAMAAPAVRAERVRLVPACVLGLVVGTLLLTVIAPRPLMILLGAFVTGYALWSLRAGGAASVLGRRWAVPRSNPVRTADSAVSGAGLAPAAASRAEPLSVAAARGAPAAERTARAGPPCWVVRVCLSRSEVSGRPDDTAAESSYPLSAAASGIAT